MPEDRRAYLKSLKKLGEYLIAKNYLRTPYYQHYLSEFRRQYREFLKMAKKDFVSAVSHFPELLFNVCVAEPDKPLTPILEDYYDWEKSFQDYIAEKYKHYKIIAELPSRTAALKRAEKEDAQAFQETRHYGAGKSKTVYIVAKSLTSYI